MEQNNVIFRNLFQLPLNAKDTHPKSQQDFSSTKLYSSPLILTLLTVFSTNQIRLPYPLFPTLTLHTYYIFYI